MTTPASGQISSADISGEFGGSAPHNLNEYYRGGGLVANHQNNSGIPTSGQIKMSDFYGTDIDYESFGHVPFSTYSFIDFGDGNIQYTYYYGIDRTNLTGLAPGGMGTLSSTKQIGKSKSDLTQANTHGFYSTYIDINPVEDRFIVLGDHRGSWFTSVTTNSAGGGVITHNRSSAVTPLGQYSASNNVTYWIWNGSSIGGLTSTDTSFDIRVTL